MRNTFYKALLAFGLLLTATSTHAQTAPGQATLDEKKVQIWCATARFVFNDNGRSNLNNTLNCNGTLKQFENSLKADSQRVYSLLYQPLEGRGVMYKGLGSDQSRLQRLVKEIVNKLGGSPQRRADPARMQQLSRLESALTAYVEQGTPMRGDIGQVTPNAAEATFDTTAAAAEPENVAADGYDAPPPAYAPTAAESSMTRLFGPIALILSLLSLVLWFLERRVLRNHISDLRSSNRRHRNELDSMKGFNGTGSTPEAPADLTFTQRKQIEELVDRLVQQRLADAAPAPRPVAPPAPVAPRPSADGAARNVRPAAKEEPAVAAASPAAAPSDGSGTTTQSRSTTSSAPAASAEPSFNDSGTTTQSRSTTSAPPPPAPAPDADFDSLIAPVQLPGPVVAAPVPPAAAPAPVVAPEPAAPEPLQSKFYVKVPVNGGFSEYDLHPTPQHDSIYEITPNPQRPDVATFRINPDPQIHAYAIQGAQNSLREACRYQPPTGNPSRIVTDEPGQLRKVGSAWRIEQKAAIRFE